MKYEDADILAFISNKSKPISDPEKVTISEKIPSPGKNTGLKEKF